MQKDIKKLEDKLDSVNMQLEEDLIKKHQCEEAMNQISLFYEQLLENSKKLQNFIQRQNYTLE